MTTPPKPTVSVVIPALNAAETLGQQLEALARQDFSDDWEVIVVDNGSTDDTAAVAREARTHPRSQVLVLSEPRRGLNVARNAGVRAASADKVAMCDADDVVSPHWLRILTDALGERDLAGGGLAFDRLNDPQTRALRGWDVDGPVASIGRELGFLDQLICGNVSFRRTVWESIGGFDERFRTGGDDVDFAWRAQLAGFRAGSRPEAVLHYRGRSSGWAMFRQCVRDGRGSAHLYAVYRQHGMPKRSSVRAARSMAALLIHLPSLPFRSPSRKGHLIRTAGKQCGRIVGSVEHRVAYL